jgi:Zn-dependent oligopeptidase
VLRAAWVSANQEQDEYDVLSWVDLYADYLAMVSNPEVFNKLKESQTAQDSEGMEIKQVNTDVRAKQDFARSGKEFVPSKNEDIAQRMKLVRERLSKKVSESIEKFEVGGTDG